MLICVVDLVVEASEDDVLDDGIGFEFRTGLAEGDPGGGFDGIAVDTTADSGEGERTESALAGDGEAGAVAAGERFGFVVFAAMPDRADGVEDVGGAEAVAAGELGLAGFAAAEGAALCEQFGAGGLVDGVVDTSAAE